jgi:hypothetical protein
VIVASYGLLQLEAPLFAGVRWHTIVLDEAQAIKNAPPRSQAVMALQGDFRMVATGTPLENHLGELWNLFRFINPGLLGTIDQFNLRFAGPIEKAQDNRAEAGRAHAPAAPDQPFILRRTKSQVLTELPPRTEIVLPVDLSKDETALYESLRRDRAGKPGLGGGAGKPEVDPDPGRDDEAAPRLLQSGAGRARAGLPAASWRRLPICSKACWRTAQGAGVQPVRRSPVADPQAPGCARHPLPVPRRFDRRCRSARSASTPSRPARATSSSSA